MSKFKVGDVVHTQDFVVTETIQGGVYNEDGDFFGDEEIVLVRSAPVAPQPGEIWQALDNYEETGIKHGTQIFITADLEGYYLDDGNAFPKGTLFKITEDHAKFNRFWEKRVK